MSKGKLARFSAHKKHKYDGHTFDSKREMLRYQDLKLLERAGELSELECQPRIKIVIGGVSVYYDSGRHMEYRADFRYYDERAKRYVYEDVKMRSGYRPEVYKMKRALVKAMGIDILETT